MYNERQFDVEYTDDEQERLEALIERLRAEGYQCNVIPWDLDALVYRITGNGVVGNAFARTDWRAEMNPNFAGKVCIECEGMFDKPQSTVLRLPIPKKEKHTEHLLDRMKFLATKEGRKWSRTYPEDDILEYPRMK